ncbi:hypothetical protein LINGRAHAP2_LOCUS10370 [Linum grandiflorum]
MHLLDSLVFEKYNAVVKPTCGHWDDGKIGRVVKKLTQPDGSLTLILKEESLIGQGLEVKEPSYLAIESDGEGEEELSVTKDDLDVPKSNPVAPAPKQRTVLPQADDPILLLTRKFPDKEQVSITRLLSVNCHFFLLLVTGFRVFEDMVGSSVVLFSVLLCFFSSVLLMSLQVRALQDVAFDELMRWSKVVTTQEARLASEQKALESYLTEKAFWEGRYKYLATLGVGDASANIKGKKKSKKPPRPPKITEEEDSSATSSSRNAAATLGEPKVTKKVQQQPSSSSSTSEEEEERKHNDERSTEEEDLNREDDGGNQPSQDVGKDTVKYDRRQRYDGDIKASSKSPVPNELSQEQKSIVHFILTKTTWDV